MGVLNYLARFGWSYGDQEIFSRDDLVAEVRLGQRGQERRQVRREEVRGRRLRAPEAAERSPATPLRAHASCRSSPRGIDDVDAAQAPAGHSHGPRARPHARRGGRGARLLLPRPPTFDEKAEKKFLTPENAVAARRSSQGLARAAADLGRSGARARASRAGSTAKGLTIKDVAQPARVALTGRTASPGLYRGARGARQRRELVARSNHGIAMRCRVNLVLLSLLQPSIFPPRRWLLQLPAFAASFLQVTYLRPFVPVPIIVARAPGLVLLPPTWRELDVEAQRYRGTILADGRLRHTVPR